MLRYLRDNLNFINTEYLIKKSTGKNTFSTEKYFDQWIERIQSFLGIPAFRVGKTEGGNCYIGEEVTVAMIQSLQSDKLSAKLYQSFGTILVDECHHIPAKTFRQVIGNFHSFYLYGFTATPMRKNKDEKLIFIYIGDIIHEVIIPVNQQGNRELSIVIQNTELFVPFNASTDKADTMLHVLIHDTARNELITNDIKREINAGRKILVLTERIGHIKILYQYLKGICEVITLTGEDREEKRKAKFNLEVFHFRSSLRKSTRKFYLKFRIRIDSINNHMIDSVRFEFVKREIFKGEGRLGDDKPIHTMEDLLSSFDEERKQFSSEGNLIDDILNIKNSRHYFQLKYLSSRHEASVLKLRFVLQPFSFLFLLGGERKYHIIWETLDSEEATYIWHADKTRESLRITCRIAQHR